MRDYVAPFDDYHPTDPAVDVTYVGREQEKEAERAAPGLMWWMEYELWKLFWEGRR